ncbi:MAG: hypothetical protein JNM84_16145 [Planctomycetes bacterium]|nr:hypothetical protein [Planctomycetota bacterium]
MTDANAHPDHDDSTTALWRTALDILGEREGAVLSLRHGAFGGERLSFGEIGRELGISRQRTHQIYEAALEKLVQNESLRGLVRQLAASPARGRAVEAAQESVASDASAATAVEGASTEGASAPRAPVAPAGDRESATGAKQELAPARSMKRAPKKAAKALSASAAPRIERRAGSVVVKPAQAVSRASSEGSTAGLEKVIAQLEGLQKFHAGVESRVRELLLFIEREMPR